MSRFDTTSKVQAFVGILVIALISLFASFKKPPFYPENLVVHIEDEDENQFVREAEVEALFRQIRKENPEMVSNEQIDLKQVEAKLQAFDFIREAQISRDLKGNIIVDIHQDQPVARIMAASGKGGYISKQGKLLKLSDHYTSRVMVITGNGADSLFRDGFLMDKKGLQLRSLIDHILSDDIWKVQLAQIHLNERLQITFYPQIGKQKIEFGDASDYEHKLEKLTAFYEQIVPNKGWNTYSTVKLQYEGQIVCE